MKHNNTVHLVQQLNYGRLNFTSSISTAQNQKFCLKSTETGNRQTNWDCEVLNGIYAALTLDSYFLREAISKQKDKHGHFSPSDYSAVF